MAFTSHVTIVGNLTKDPEITYTKSGKAKCLLNVAVNTRRKAEDGSWVDGDPQFYRIVAWEYLAENAGDSLSKGNRVMVAGTLKYRSWKGDNDEHHSIIEIVADDIGASVRFATIDGIVKATKSGGSSSENVPDSAYDEDY